MNAQINEKKLHQGNEAVVEFKSAWETQFEVEGQLNEILYSITNAHSLIEELTQEFFNLSFESADGKYMLDAEFNRNKPYADMLFDYVHRTKEAAEKLRQYHKSYFEFLKAEKAKK